LQQDRDHKFNADGDFEVAPLKERGRHFIFATVFKVTTMTKGEVNDVQKTELVNIFLINIFAYA
jgi:hypothetical protein